MSDPASVSAVPASIPDAGGLKTGFHPFEQCARGLKYCRSLMQIVSTEDEQTITCCGEVLNGATPEPRDQWSLCIKSRQDRAHTAGNDLRIFVDRQDISHIGAVLGYARALIDSSDLFNDDYAKAIEARQGGNAAGGAVHESAVGNANSPDTPIHPVKTRGTE